MNKFVTGNRVATGPVAVLIVLASIAFTSSTSQAQELCQETGEVSIEDIELGAIVCRGSDVSVILPDTTFLKIPEPGNYVGRHLITADGGETEADYAIWVSPAGAVGLSVGGNTYGLEPSSPQFASTTGLVVPASSPSSAQGCNNSDGSLDAGKWDSTFKWWYAPRNEVSTYSRNRFGSALQTWVAGLSKCSTINAYNSLVTSFMGNSSRIPSIGSDLSCPLFSDSTSVVGWKAISPNPQSAIGATCTWGTFITKAQLSEADIVLSSNVSWYFPEETAPCSEAFDMQEVATHEFGHAIGVGHAGSVSGQVMDNFSTICAAQKRRLGLGDVLSLLTKYPLS